MALNCYTVQHRHIRFGIEAVGGGIILGAGFRRGDRKQTITFDSDRPPTLDVDRINLARPIRLVRGQIALADSTVENTPALVRIEASEVISQNLKARVIVKATCYGRRGTHQPPQCDVLVWLEDGGAAIISFGSWKHRMVLTNNRGKLALERFRPNR